MEKVGDAPALGGGPRTAHVVGVDVRVDHGGGGGFEVAQNRFVVLQVSPGVHDHRVAIAREHVAERAFSHPVDLYDVLERARGGEGAGQVDGVPRRHST